MLLFTVTKNLILIGYFGDKLAIEIECCSMEIIIYSYMLFNKFCKQLLFNYIMKYEFVYSY